MDFSLLKLKYNNLYSLCTELPPRMARSSEVMSFAHINWEVELRDLYYKLNDGTFAKAPKYRANVMKKNNKFLGVFGATYTPRQNIDMFKFFDHIVSSMDIKYKFAGSLYDDTMVYIVAVEENAILTDKHGCFDGYYVISNSHNGRIGLCITYHLLHRQTQTVINLPPSLGNCRHRMSSIDKKQHAKQAMSFVADMKKATKIFGEFLIKAANIKMSVTDIDKYFNMIYPQNYNETTQIKAFTYGNLLKNDLLVIYQTLRGYLIIDMFLATTIWINYYRKYIDDGKLMQLIVQNLTSPNKFSKTISESLLTLIKEHET